MFYSVNRQYSGIEGKSPQYLDHPSVKQADFGRSPEGMDTEKRIRFTRGDVPTKITPEKPMIKTSVRSGLTGRSDGIYSAFIIIPERR
jgi:hypothetical protein